MAEVAKKGKLQKEMEARYCEKQRAMKEVAYPLHERSRHR